MVVNDLPYAETLRVVDVNALVSEEEIPPVDPATCCPTRLMAVKVSKDPDITVFPKFFSEAECDHLVGLVEGYWMPSLVGAGDEKAYKNEKLENTLSKTRTSWSCMMRYAQTDIVERLEHRLSGVSGIPLQHLERLNMVRYSPGELFNIHHDGHFRPRTVFVYLNDVPEDDEGDTFFPVLGYSFRPTRGTAVMWPNVTADGKEDARMIHAGRAPLKNIKYGVNCFFNAKPIRFFGDNPGAFPDDSMARVVVRDQLSGDGVLSVCSVSKSPNIVAVPCLIGAEEVAHFRKLALPSEDARLEAAPGIMESVTRTWRTLAAGETPEVEQVEARVAAVTGLPIGYLGRLRLVKPSSKLGCSNRGCGQKSVYICLSESEEVVFPNCGLRFVLAAGDALCWYNVSWTEDEVPMEDTRTYRFHLQGSQEPYVGIDAFLHEQLLREQQSKRYFVPDSAVCKAAQGA